MQVHDILYKIQICGHEHCSFIYHCLHCYALIKTTVVAGKSSNTLPSMCSNENSLKIKARVRMAWTIFSRYLMRINSIYQEFPNWAPCVDLYSHEWINLFWHHLIFFFRLVMHMAVMLLAAWYHQYYLKMTLQNPNRLCKMFAGNKRNVHPFMEYYGSYCCMVTAWRAKVWLYFMISKLFFFPEPN